MTTCTETDRHTPGRTRTRTRNPLGRAQAGIGLTLVVLTGAAWALLVRQQGGTDHAAAMTPTMGMGLLLFLAVWVAMVAAMMFPAVAPMILMFARVSANRRANGKTWAPTSAFVAGYVLLWTAIGAAAFLLATGGEELAERAHVVGDDAARVGALLIVTAGVYQFSALKDRCLTECRSPLAFLSEHWRDGDRGALAMGVHHGLHCAGCCWALMAMLFPLGMMNIAALGAVTLFIYAEKALPGGQVLRYAAGVGLVAFGAWAFLDPGVLPGVAAHAGHPAG
jgi:predicted metal-binding membrane protein